MNDLDFINPTFLMGKKMNDAHIIGRKAEQILKSILPSHWVLRSMNPDYGIDFDLELFNSKGFALGEHVFIQLKGTEKLKIGKFKTKYGECSVCKFPIDVNELNLVDKMGFAFVTLLILIDVNSGEAYFLCLNDYIDKVLPLQNKDYKNQKTVTLNIPLENKLIPNDLRIIEWYGLRLKFISFISEMNCQLESISSIYDKDEFFTSVKSFVDQCANHWIFEQKNLWCKIKNLNDTLVHMSQNNYLNSEGTIIFEGYSYESEVKLNIPPYSASSLYETQFIMSFEKIKRTIGLFNDFFHTCCREWTMPALPVGFIDE